MEELRLVAPSARYASQIADYRAEFLAHGDSMDGTANLRKFEDPADWLSWLAQTAAEETCPAGLVPETEFLCVRTADDRLVGMIDIRHRLNDYLLQFGGHIGYSIRKSERRKGYAKEQLRLALEECRVLGLTRVLITCSRENTGSQRTILAAGGELENEVFDPGDGTMTQRYWVPVQRAQNT